MEALWAAILGFLHSIQLLLPQADLVYLAAFFGALAAILPFYRRISNFVYKTYLEPVGKFFSTFATLPDRLQALETKVDHKVTILQELHYKDVAEIKKELTPNGGTSLKDTVNKLAVGIDKIATNIESLAVQGNRMEIRQQDILNSVTIPTFETNKDGECVFANKAYLELIGRAMDEIRGPSWINMIHPDDRARVRAEWLSAVTEKRTFELTYRIVGRDDMIYDVACAATSIAGNGYIGKFESVTPRGMFNSH
jgi:PAS domain S-box-containing protein